MGAELGGEPIGIVVAEKNRETFDAVAIRRQAMRLRVVDHLQPVLEPAQKAIVAGQRLGRLGIDAAGSGERPQRIAGRPDPELAQPAAPDQLLRLREELDFPDAAAPDLDVVTLDRDSATTLVRLDLALDRVNV